MTILLAILAALFSPEHGGGCPTPGDVLLYNGDTNQHECHALNTITLYWDGNAINWFITGTDY